MEKLMQTYHKKLENYFWDYLVPPSGQAETAQGEIIRIAGRIQHEMLDNGCEAVNFSVSIDEKSFW